MKTIDLGRHNNIEQIQEKIDAGEKRDPKTGREWVLGEADKAVSLEPEDAIWLWIADLMAATIPSEGSQPDPQKAVWVLEHGLGAAEICHPCNQEWLMNFLRHGYFGGRSEGLNDKLEKPKAPTVSKGKTTKKPPKRARRGRRK